MSSRCQGQHWLFLSEVAAGCEHQAATEPSELLLYTCCSDTVLFKTTRAVAKCSQIEALKCSSNFLNANANGSYTETLTEDKICPDEDHSFAAVKVEQ